MNNPQSQKTDRENKPSPQVGEIRYFIIKTSDYAERARINFLKSNPHIQDLLDQGLIELVITESGSGAITIFPVSI